MKLDNRTVFRGHAPCTLQRMDEAVASSGSAAGEPQPDVHSKYLYFSLAELILVSGVASWSAGDLYDSVIRILVQPPRC